MHPFQVSDFRFQVSDFFVRHSVTRQLSQILLCGAVLRANLTIQKHFTHGTLRALEASKAIAGSLTHEEAHQLQDVWMERVKAIVAREEKLDEWLSIEKA